LPPDARIAAPACDAITLSLATTPDCEMTIDRDCDRSCPPATWANAQRSPDTMTYLTMLTDVCLVGIARHGH
jgi:hypothetical protein